MANQNDGNYDNVMNSRPETDQASDSDEGETYDGFPMGTLARRNGLKVLSQKSLRSRFIQSIRRKDVNGVKHTLSENPSKKLHNAEDEFGTSSMEYAVLSNSTDIVETLLYNCSKPDEKIIAIRRALLIAIRQNNIDMVDFLLDQNKLVNSVSDERKASIASLTNSTTEFLNAKTETRVLTNNGTGGTYADPSAGNHGCSRANIKHSISRDSHFEVVEYSQGISPLVLAAQLDRVEIVNLLFAKCHPDIHPVVGKCSSVTCFLCQERKEFMGRRTLERSRESIEIFKALASPAFILEAAKDDPLLEVFRLYDLMQCRKTADPSFGDEYQAVSDKCQQFAVDFLGLCRTSGETAILLNRLDGVEKTNRKGSKSIFPRLLVAMHYDQKEFIAHPICQQAIENAWYEGLPDWVCHPNKHVVRMALYGLVIFLMFPILVPLYMLKVPVIDRFLKPASQRFLTDSVSYFFFILILLIELIFGSPSKRDELPTPTEWLILIWTLGFMARYIKMTIRRRQRWCNFQNIEHANWKFWDLCLWLSFSLKFIFKFIAYSLAQNQIGGHPNDRRTWRMYDPFLVAECFYSIGCIISITQIYSYFKASRALGPLQITMKKMVIDVLHFLILFGISLSAFAFGIAALYRNYQGYTRIDKMFTMDDDDHEKIQPHAFDSLRNTYKTLFWNLFDPGHPEYADIVVGNEDNHDRMMKHKITEGVGYVMFGAYNVISVVVLLNMLIAMMAHSYESIEANSDTEWKYARTRMRMSYFNEVGCIPPPFNLIPLRYIVKWLNRCCSKLGPGCHKCQNYQKRKKSSKEVQESLHKELMERFKKRYWKSRISKEITTTSCKELQDESPKNSPNKKKLSKQASFA